MTSMQEDMEFEESIKKRYPDPISLGAFLATQIRKQECTCEEIKNHLAISNGSMLKIKERQIQIRGDLDDVQDNQKHLLRRIWEELPNQVRIPLALGGIVWLIMSVVAMYAGFIHL